MTGLIVGALLFALLAVIGSSWMSGDEDGVEANYSLSEAEIKAEFLKWNRASGREIPGVTNRRIKEFELYSK